MKLLVILWLVTLGICAKGPYSDEQPNGTVDFAIGNEQTHISDNTCWASLSCSFAEIESMNMKNRLQFVKYMGTRQFVDLASTDEFGAVEGVMSFFIRRNVALSGSWLSIINAAVVEAFEHGAALSLGMSNETGRNPAAVKWQEFFDKRARGGLMDRSHHDVAWAVAEQTAIDHGIRLADSDPGVEEPPNREVRWEKFTKVYRTIMQFRPTILRLVRFAFSFTDPSVSMRVEAFIDWFTDVTDGTSTGFLADIAWRISGLGLSWDGEEHNSTAADMEVILQVASELREAFQRGDGIE